MVPAAVAGLFPGHVTDRSFMQAGHDGLRDACARTGLALVVQDGVRLGDLRAAFDRAAAEAALVVAQGGQCEGAAAEAASRWPDRRFVVVQGHRGGGTLSAYRAAQEQSAFLAGAAAALMTSAPVLGHVSGIRPKPGLVARAAFAAGVAAVAPGRRVVSIFTGDQDDLARGEAAAERLAEAGADIVFAMLNAAQSAVMQVARRRGLRLVGDGQDWVAAEPDLFDLAAIADTGPVAASAVEDFVAGRLAEERVFTLDQPAVVRLACGARVPWSIRRDMARLAGAITAGRLAIPEQATVQEIALD